MMVIVRLLLCVLSGTMIFVSYPTFDLFPLAWIAFVPLLLAIEGESPKRVFLYALLAGFVKHLGGFYWITGLLIDFGQIPAWIAGQMCGIFALYQALRMAIPLYVMRKLSQRIAISELWLMPVTLTVAEWLIPHLFPSYYGNSQYLFYTVIQICEITGVFGLSFLLFLVNATLFQLLLSLKRHEPVVWRNLVITAVLFVGVIVFGVVRIKHWDEKTRSAKKLKIVMVEANIGIWEKEARGYPVRQQLMLLRHNLIRHQKLAVAAIKKYDPDLVVMPESAYQTLHVPFGRKQGKKIKWGLEPYVLPRDATHMPQSDKPLPKSDTFPADVNEDYRKSVMPFDYWAVQRGFKKPVLLGVITGRPGRRWEEIKKRFPDKPPIGFELDTYNTTILLDEKGKIRGKYDKNYILLFGEYIPLGETFPIFYKWLPNASRFLAGTDVKTFEFKGYQLGIMICYEDIIPQFTRRLAGKKPNLLVNVTNDAWFGKTSEPRLHLALAIFRAVENRLWLVRSTNTGISAYVDAVGRIRKTTSLEGEEILYDEVAMLHSNTIYRRFGDFVGYLSLAALLLFFALFLKAGPDADPPAPVSRKKPSPKRPSQAKPAPRKTAKSEETPPRPTRKKRVTSASDDGDAKHGRPKTQSGRKPPKS